ncbi:SIR2 family protein [Pseudoalteromonas sp. SMS1]|uniref:P-loop NTPase n=1 Tax=Pseudoalteromonas sp. SMS1 TaxID=2908894 RepID=UPI001F3ECE16|nr:SIR2 family protein [Pseudoalteromonas sp. SMS1]MCF2859484.1 SIR2 family protein [Pseudoalteromonas sp. SMS1]
MKIDNLGNLEVKSNYDRESLRTIIEKAHAGNTLLFIGAGYSLGSTNTINKPIPLASELSVEICKLGNFEEDNDLAYSADYYLKYNDAEKLIGLIKEYFNITGVSSHHQSVAKINWRRVYTTNYDNCFELAAGNVDKSILPLTLESNPTQYFRARNVCIHINGAIQTLDCATLEDSFKLSESSYTNSDAFSDSSWAYRFKKDIELCNQIIFIGYSLYDMEVKRLLVNNEDIKKKTFFITREAVSTKEHHRLSAFGEVFPIGVEKFGQLLEDATPQHIPDEIDYLSSLSRQSIEYEKNYRDSDIRDFLLRGKCSTEFISMSMTSDSTRYAIEREQVSEILDILKSKNVVILHGALANGKSTIAKQVMSSLIIEGKLVYTIKDDEADYEKDIEKLAALNQNVYLFVDDFEGCLDLVRYYTAYLKDNGKLVLTERPHRYRKAVGFLSDFGMETYNVNVDYLHSKEIVQMEEIISNSGLWGELAGNSYEKRLGYLTDHCESQLSIILLNILKSPDVISRFDRAFKTVLSHPDTKKTVHAICLIQHIYPAACTKSFIADISGSNHVYSAEFENRVNETSIFEFKYGDLVTRSSVFGTFILNSLYKASYSIDQLVRIVEKLQRNRATQTREESEIYRSIMTFGTISAILPDENKSDSYIEFYEKLKGEVPQVIGNPHFWLQYGMAVMSTNNLGDAEIILKTAYAKAENNADYDTTYIDNQFARLNLKKAIIEERQDASISFFLDAHKILKREENDIYKFRQAGLYISYFEKRYDDLSKGNKVKFEHALRDILKQYEEFISYEYPTGSVPPFQSDNLEEFKMTIDSITRQRKS